MRRHLNRSAVTIIIFILAGLISGCFGEEPDRTSQNNANVNVQNTPDEFKQKLEALKTADFDYIFTFRRKDGEKFDSEDKSIFKAHTFRANRRRLSNDEKVLFVGTNYEIEEKDMKVLKERFDFEDFSKSEEQIKKEAEKNQNTKTEENGNKNANE
ncbi:MAG: hypothetical protein R2681_16285 [Pyrinomonadaceae bacterium]